MASGQTGFFEIVNTAINTPYTNAADYDMVLRTDQPQQKLLLGNGSNTTPAITLSNNRVTMQNMYTINNPLCAVWTLKANSVASALIPQSTWSNISAVYGNLGSYSEPMNASGYLVIPVKGIYSISFSGRVNTVQTWNTTSLRVHNGYGASNGSPEIYLNVTDTTGANVIANYTGPFLAGNWVSLLVNNAVLTSPVPILSLTLLQALP